MEQNKEIWRDIKGFEGLYQISTLGRVKRLLHKRRGNTKHVLEEMILKPYYHNEYLRINLHKNGKNTHHKIHRLVAEAFIPNPKNLPQVNHKDEDKFNNCVDNLEWCTNWYNSNYGTRFNKDRRMVLKDGECFYTISTLHGDNSSITHKRLDYYFRKNKLNNV